MSHLNDLVILTYFRQFLPELARNSTTLGQTTCCSWPPPKCLKKMGFEVNLAASECPSTIFPCSARPPIVKTTKNIYKILLFVFVRMIAPP
jgi:hypothetical protein